MNIDSHLTAEQAQDRDRRAMEICLTLPRDLEEARAILDKASSFLYAWEVRGKIDQSNAQAKNHWHLKVVD